MLGFLRHVAREARWHVNNKQGIYRLIRSGEGIEIRQGVTIINPERFHCPGPLRVETGCFLHCGGNTWSNHDGEIRLGKACWIAQNALIYGAGTVVVGDHTGLGPGSMIFSSRDNYSMEHAFTPHIVHHFGKVTIGSYVRVFAGVIVGPGVTIGDGAVIGAGSVVLTDIPPWVIAAGAPAKVLRRRDKDSVSPGNGDTGER